MAVCIPVCFECGTTDNPCRCKVVGPTLGFVAFCVAALVEWPVGAVVWCFNHKKGSDIMANPVDSSLCYYIEVLYIIIEVNSAFLDVASMMYR